MNQENLTPMFCPNCGADELDQKEVGLDTFQCSKCEEVYDINAVDQDEDSIPDCIWEAMVKCNPDLRD